tara:strand:+ start:289 stop:390 length:102 start_codon:yes stop_codon:yes gene_type:complete
MYNKVKGEMGKYANGGPSYEDYILTEKKIPKEK